MKKWIVLAVAAGTVLAVLGLLTRKSQTKQPAPEETAAPAETDPTYPPLPDSVLYYGEIKELVTDEEGKLSQLRMESPKDGPWFMNLGEETVYIDSGRRIPFDPARLTAGDRVYVFHSPIAARSMPPQSPAFAVAAYIPMDASCAMYHEIEEIRQEGDRTLIVTDNGEKTLGLEPDAELLTYDGRTAQLQDLTVGGHVMAWYWDRGEDVLSASHLMLLPQ